VMDNPFSQSGGSADKIEDPFEEQNPFANESAYVSPARSSKSDSAYTNPYAGFEEQTTKPAPQSMRPQNKSSEKPAEKPKTAPKTTQTSSAYSYTPLQDDDVGSSDISNREAKLLRKERELLERERALEQKEMLTKGDGGVRRQLYNWPSKCYPLAYHSIQDEIPPNHRAMVKKFYFVLYVSWVCLFWNWLTILTVWGQEKGSDSANSALWATIYMSFGIPGAWKLWYRSVYFCCRDGAGIRWAFFFLNFFMHLAFSILMAVGVPSIGSGGLFVMVDMFANSYRIAGLFALVDMIIWTLNCIMSALLLRISYKVWKVGGGPTKASQEAMQALLAAQAQQQQHQEEPSVREMQQIDSSV